MGLQAWQRRPIVVPYSELLRQCRWCCVKGFCLFNIYTGTLSNRKIQSKSTAHLAPRYYANKNAYRHASMAADLWCCSTKSRHWHIIGTRDVFFPTVNTSRRNLCRHSCVIGTRIVCTDFPPLNRLRYRQYQVIGIVTGTSDLRANNA